ncbi:serine hydrolase [Streptomyces sp. NPDC004647]|uniref:D-alanyl-D-alanine carboxypeptidase family protein n=1 Tax=Streptomyces sp. NPDC004647 TaxID=3154671 RepID=UPI0033AB3B97
MDTKPGLNTRIGAAAAIAGCLVVICPAAPAYADGEGQRHAPPPAAAGGPRLGRPGVQVLPQPGAPKLPQGLSARSWMISDARTGRVLAAKDAHRQLPPASTLKTLFAVTVLPKLPPKELRTVSEADLAGVGAGSSQVGVRPGKRYTVADLWRGVFLSSGNDAVHALAAMNGSMPATIAQMRAKAQALGANDTRVVSADGYDAPGQVSSAYDLSLFARAGLADADFARYCSTAMARFPNGRTADGKEKGSFRIQNTNRLLVGAPGVNPYRGLIGVKNGYTSRAGNTLVVAARRGGRTLVATVMNPQSGTYNAVYHEARSLLDWGFAAAGKVTAVGYLHAPRGTVAPLGFHAPQRAAGPLREVHPTRTSAAPDRTPPVAERATAAVAVAHGSPATGWLAAGAGSLILCGSAAVLHRRRRALRRRG